MESKIAVPLIETTLRLLFHQTALVGFLRIVTFNNVEGWCRDVTMDLADELRRRYVEYDEVPASILDFLEANRR